MHGYINSYTIYDFSKKKSLESVYKDLKTKYCPTNVVYYEDDEDVLYVLSNTLLYDYQNHIINYEAYIEHGIDLRLFIELRKSALIRIKNNELRDSFFRSHSSCDTFRDVKEVRIDFIRKFNDDYRDWDWQYYMLVSMLWGNVLNDIQFNYETFFADCDRSKQTDYETYKRDFIDAHTMPREVLEHGYFVGEL